MDRLTEPQLTARFAAATGRPLLPHQSDMVTSITERAGLGYRHGTVVVLMPRQVGKTATVLALLLARMHLRRGYAAAYTAQTGIVVTRVFANPMNGWITTVEQTPQVRARFRSTRSQGREMIIHRGNPGASLMAFPPTPGRLRSTSLDCVVFDECQEHSRDVGAALMADTGPTFSTRPRRQLLLMGTAPDSEDSWWWDQVQRGRDGGVGLVEVGTWPADSDPEDPAVWAAHHPGVIHGLTSIEFLQAELGTLGRERFAREYGNRVPSGATVDSPITTAVWDAARWRGEPPPPAVVAFDAAPGGRGAITVAAPNDEGGVTVGLWEQRPGVGWIADEVRGLVARWPGLLVVADRRGPAAAVIDALERDHVRVDVLPAADAVTAHAHLVTEMTAGRVRVLTTFALDDARAAARRRWLTSGEWVWSRRLSGDAAAIYALTWSVWAARPTASTRPVIVAA